MSYAQIYPTHHATARAATLLSVRLSGFATLATTDNKDDTLTAGDNQNDAPTPAPGAMRITTWNVNGIRNPFGYQPWRETRSFEAMFDILEADIVVMQELKIQRKDLGDDMVLVNGWDCYFSLPKHKKGQPPSFVYSTATNRNPGYSGVAIYTRQSTCAPIRAEEGILGVLCPPGSKIPYCQLPEDQHIGGYLTLSQLVDVGVDAVELDSEGRCVVVEFPAFVLFGIYSPANSSGTRDDFRHGFLNALDMRIRNLVKAGKRVVVTGDLNVSRSPLDTANADENMRKEGITFEQYMSAPNRRIFNQLLEGGHVIGERDEGREEPVMWDICRAFHPTRKGMYTHWEQKINARPGNFGSRIDFVLCSLDMKPWFSDSNIQEGLFGSDHCPVYAVLKDEVEIDDSTTYLADLVNPPGYFSQGKRTQPYSVKDVPTFSAKLLPDFDKRRSIKDMFSKKPSSVTSQVAEPAAEAAPQTPPPARRQSDASAVSASQHSSTLGSPDRKRPAPAPPLQQRAGKKRPAPASTKGQQSLKGFFQSKPADVVSPAISPFASGDAVSQGGFNSVCLIRLRLILATFALLHLLFVFSCLDGSTLSLRLCSRLLVASLWVLWPARPPTITLSLLLLTSRCSEADCKSL